MRPTFSRKILGAMPYVYHMAPIDPWEDVGWQYRVDGEVDGWTQNPSFIFSRDEQSPVGRREQPL
jgi:hypothetical protein